MHQADFEVGEDLAGQVFVLLLRGFHGLRLRLFDNGVDHIGLAALVDLRLHEAVHLFDGVAGGVFGDDGLAAGRHLVDDADIEIAVHRHGEGARDGGGGHHENVGRDALLHEAEALQDAEAMLLVDDGEAEVLELDILLNQGVGADGDLHQPFGHQLLELHFFPGGEAAGEQGGDVAQLAENLFEGEAVLGGEDFRRREHGHLVAVLDGDDGGFGGDDGLTAAHVALQQAVHGMGRRHILSDLFEDALLGAGGLEGQHGFHAFANAIVQLKGDAGNGSGLAALQGDAALQPEKLLDR